MFNKRTLAERLLAAALCLVLLVGMLPAGALPAFAAADSTVGTNEETTQPSEPTGETTAPSDPAGDSEEETEPTENKKGTVTALIDGLKITDDQDGNVTVSIADTLKLEWIPVDASIGRNEAGWRVGFSIAAPEGMEDVSNAKFDYAKPNGTVAEDQLYTDYSTGTTLNVWPLITEDLVKKGDVSCSITIDWNGDGTNVQTVEVQLEQDKLILLDEQGKQAWPSLYADLYSSMGGDLTGWNTDHTVLTVKDKEVTWRPADEKIGRPAGWTIDAVVVAPDGEETTYWLELQPENGSYEEIDGILEGDFTWAGDVKQYMAIVAENITLLKAEQDKPVFENSNAVINITTSDMEYSWSEGGYTFTNAVTENSKSTAVGQLGYAYAPNDDGVVTKIENGKITFSWKELSKELNKNGTYQLVVTATFAETDTHTATSATYTLNIGSKLDTSLKFNESGSLTVYYGENNNTFSGKIVTDEFAHKGYGPFYGKKLVSSCTFNSSNEAIATVIGDKDGNYTISILDVGEVEISVEVEYSDIFSNTTATLKLKIEPGKQTIEFTKPNQTTITYSPDGTYDFSIDKETIDAVDATVTYQIDQEKPATEGTSIEKVATVDADGKVTTVQSGTFRITAIVSGDSNYQVTPKEIIVTVVKADQAPLVFDVANPDNITYNDNGNKFVNAASGGTLTTDILYKVTAGESVAKFADEKDPELTIQTAGTVTVTATRPGNECYNDVSASYTLTIKKAKQDIRFEKSTEETPDKAAGEEITGTEKYSFVMVPGALCNAKAKFEYSIFDPKNDWDKDEVSVAAGEDNNVGVINIADVAKGEIVIKVTREGNECYEAWTGYFTLTVSENGFDLSDSDFTIVCDDENCATKHTNGWHTGTVTIGTVDNKYELFCKDSDGACSNNHNMSWKHGIEISGDGVHTVILCAKDGEGHIDHTAHELTIKIDKTAPVNATISYSDDVWGKVLDVLTFGYYDRTMTVELFATDSLSGVAKFFYRLSDDAQWIELKAENDRVSFLIDPQYEGKVQYYAVDVAGNETQKFTGKTTIIVDNVKPTINVIWPDAKLELEDGTLLYDGEVTSEVIITEKNFFNGEAEGEIPGIKVFDNNEEIAFNSTEWTLVEGTTESWKNTVTLKAEEDHVLRIEYADRSKNPLYNEDESKKGIYESVKVTIDTIDPVISLDLEETPNRLYFADRKEITLTVVERNFDPNKVQFFVTAKDVFGKDLAVAPAYSEWSTAADGITHTVTLTFTEEADYTLDVTCTDLVERASNDLSERLFTVDDVDPVISLDLEETPDRLYYNDTKVIKLTVVERNFNASKVQYHLTAKDVSGNDLTVEPAYSEWTTASDGITHTITLTFDAEANYTLDVTYADEAGRESNDLAERLFTVDKTAPEGLTISYSTNVWGEIIDNLTFGYYNVPVTVTITANDTISGVRQFLYSYIREAGVSGVNLEKLEKLIAEAQVEQVDGGHTFRAQFQIPENELEQINGKISFTAVDYAENQTTLADDKTLVVDNIRPNASVNYNAPVRTVGNVSYYAGNIEVTLSVIEANFFAEDVKVTVTKDGVSYPVEVVWSNVSVDDHIGTFTLTEDGVYEVSVTYTDRSNNTMDQYKSGELTIDTVKPEVNVSGIVNNSANTDKVFSFSITASDINFDVDGFQPLLMAVLRKDSGNYSTEAKDLGEVKVVVEGNTYTFEIADLKEDAVYTLTCTVKDLAGNITTAIVLDDGKSYEKVQFSINRNGSTFALDEYTQQLVKEFYVQNVTQDLVVFEVNADELVSHSVTLNGVELVEGTNYTVTSEGTNNSWMKYTYTVSKDRFAEEGEYMLVVSSKDKAGNDAFSDVKDATVSFVVDRTAPVITVSGMANNGRYQTDKQTVTLIPTDDGGALNSIVVRMVDDNGNMLKEVLNLSGDALIEALETGDGKLTFEIGEGLYQNVQVICTDSATGANGSNVYNETFTNLSVSANAFMIFWANTGLRWGVIGGTGAAALAIIFLLLGKKKKKEDKEEAK